MDLFPNDPATNLLPCDGTVHYHGPILDPTESHDLYTHLLENILWKNDEAVIFGKRIITARKVAWYGDSNFPYTTLFRSRHSAVALNAWILPKVRALC